MERTEYLRFYNECMNHNMIIERFIPVEDYIFKIFNHYKNTWTFFDADDDRKIGYSEELIKLFDRIMNENKYENLDEYINLLLYLDVAKWSFLTFLKILVYKDKTYPESENRFYYHHISRIIDNVIDKKEHLWGFHGNSRFTKMIRIFMNYYVNHHTNPDYNAYVKEKRSIYYNIGVGVIADIYNTDLDLSLLEKFLHDLVYDYDNLVTYLELNGLVRDYDATYGIDYAYETLQKFDSDDKTLIKQEIL